MKKPLKVNRRKAVKHYLQGLRVRTIRRFAPQRVLNVKNEIIEVVPIKEIEATRILIGGRASEEECEKYSVFGEKLNGKFMPLGKKATLHFRGGEFEDSSTDPFKQMLYREGKFKLLKRIEKVKKPIRFSMEVIAKEKGLGTKLLTLIERHAKENENDFIFATTTNPAAVGAFRKRGWTLLCREKGKWHYGMFLKIKK